MNTFRSIGSHPGQRDSQTPGEPIDPGTNTVYITAVLRTLLSLIFIFATLAPTQAQEAASPPSPLPRPAPPVQPIRQGGALVPQPLRPGSQGAGPANPGGQRPIPPGLPGGFPAPNTSVSPTGAPQPGLGGVDDSGLPTLVQTFEFGASSDVKDVLDLYATLTGKQLLYDNSVLGAVPIHLRDRPGGMLPRDEAIRLIEIALNLNGFALVPVDDRISKVLGLGNAPQPAGTPLYTELSSLPDNEILVSFLFKLKYLDTQKAVQTFQFLLQNGKRQMQPVALADTPAILVTDYVSVIRSLGRIIQEVDTPPAEVVSEFFELQRASVKDVIELLNQLFEKQPTGTGVANPNRPAVAQVRTAGGIALNSDGTPAPNPNQPNGIQIEATGSNTFELSGKLSEDSIIVGKIKISADERTNRLHVVTRPVNLPFIRKLLLELDADVPFGTPTVRALRHVSVGDVLQAVVQAIADPGAKDAAGGTGTTGSRTGTQAGRTTGGGDVFNRGNDSLGGGRGGGGLGGGGGSGLSLSESLSASERDTIPETIAVGNSKIVADKANNKIIVFGTEDVKQKVFALLDELDVRQPQVTIYTIIGELNLTENEQFSVSYILKANGQNINTDDGTDTGTGGGTGGGTGAAAAAALASFTGTNPVLNFNSLLGQGLIKNIAAGGGGGLSGFVTAGNALTAVIDALESTNKFKVISRPSIFTTNNKRATIASGEEIAVPTTIQSGFNGGGGTNNGLVTNSSIQFKTVALQLDVLPLINSDKEVSLEIVQKVDEQNGTTRIDNNDIPKIATRVIKTNAIVPNNGTLILGGLIKARDDRTKGGIPILNRLPIVGPFFGRNSKNKTRTELVIMMRPVVTLGPREDIGQRESESQYLNVSPDLETELMPQGIRKRIDKPVQIRRAMPVLREPVAPTPAPRLRSTKPAIKR